MSSVNVVGKLFKNPPQTGFIVTHYMTVDQIDRSLAFYEKVFEGRILRGAGRSDGPGILQIANTWLIMNTGGGPTIDKPSITLDVPSDSRRLSSFLNIRVFDIQVSYKIWKSRGAEFITEPQEMPSEFRCYMRDPDGYVIEVGQSKFDPTRT
jgi:predicted enzyme related to lactoylglutathione lyase